DYAGVYAGAGIGHLEQHKTAVQAVSVVGRSVARHNSEFSAAGHRILGVDSEIDQRQLQFGWIDVDCRRVLCSMACDLDRAPEHRLQKIQEPGDSLLHQDPLRLQRLLAGESEDLPSELRAGADGTLDRLELLALNQIGIQVSKQVEIVADNHHQVIEIVRNPAGEAPHRFELLRLNESEFDALAMCRFFLE